MDSLFGERKKIKKKKERILAQRKDKGKGKDKGQGPSPTFWTEIETIDLWTRKLLISGPCQWGQRLTTVPERKREKEIRSNIKHHQGSRWTGTVTQWRKKEEEEEPLFPCFVCAKWRARWKIKQVIRVSTLSKLQLLQGSMQTALQHVHWEWDELKSVSTLPFSPGSFLQRVAEAVFFFFLIFSTLKMLIALKRRKTDVPWRDKQITEACVFVCLDTSDTQYRSGWVCFAPRVSSVKKDEDGDGDGDEGRAVALDITLSKYILCTWDETTKGLFVVDVASSLPSLSPTCYPPVLWRWREGQGCISKRMQRVCPLREKRHASRL